MSNWYIDGWFKGMKEEIGHREDLLRRSGREMQDFIEEARRRSGMATDFIREIEANSVSALAAKAAEGSLSFSRERLRGEFQYVQQSLAGDHRTHDVARELSAFGRDHSLTDSKEVYLLRERLAASIQPFPGLRYIDDQRREAFERLSYAVSDAKFIAEIDLGDTKGEESDSDTASRVEEELTELAPSETISQLRNVEFVPLVLLDKILRHPEAMRMLGAREFEQFIATLIGQLGFESIVLTPSSGDEGRDILATKRVNGIPIFFAFECKRYSPDRPVGPEILRALLGTIRHPLTPASMGVLVTTSTFSPASRKFLLTEPSLDGKDFEDVVSWLRERGKRAEHGTR